MILFCFGGFNGSICLFEIFEWLYKVNWVNSIEFIWCFENIFVGFYLVDIIEF